MRKLTHQERDTIRMYIKNGLDISKIIKDKDIRDENFNRAIIKSFDHINNDISGCSLAFAKIGSPNVVTKIIKTKMNNCNCECLEFVGPTWFRSCEAKNCNFKGADLSKVDYRFSDFSGSSFCESIIRISTKSGIGCKFPKSMFEELCKGWNMKITIENIKKEEVK